MTVGIMGEANKYDGRRGGQQSSVKQRLSPAAEKVWRAESQVPITIPRKLCPLL